MTSGQVDEARTGVIAFVRLGPIEFDKASFRPAVRALLASQDIPVVRSEMARTDAIKYFQDPAHFEPYKVELMEGWDSDTVSFYTQGTFSDLCRGPHVPTTAKLNPAPRSRMLRSPAPRGPSCPGEARRRRPRP